MGRERFDTGLIHWLKVMYSKPYKADWAQYQRYETNFGFNRIARDVLKINGVDQLLAAGNTVTVETDGTIGRRVTITRLATLGIFALGVPKTVGSIYMVFTPPAAEPKVVPVPAQHDTDARLWAAEFNRRTTPATVTQVRYDTQPTQPGQW